MVPASPEANFPLTAAPFLLLEGLPFVSDLWPGSLEALWSPPPLCAHLCPPVPWCTLWASTPWSTGVTCQQVLAVMVELFPIEGPFPFLSTALTIYWIFLLGSWKGKNALLKCWVDYFESHFFFSFLMFVSEQSDANKWIAIFAFWLCEFHWVVVVKESCFAKYFCRFSTR